MKKLVHVLVVTLAMNFLALAGFVGWLHQTKRIDRDRIAAIRQILFPDAAPATQPSTEPSADPTTQPILRLEELLARTTGRPATEQVQFIQHSFDTQMTQLERRERELSDLQRQVEAARQQLTRDRSAITQQQAQLTAREEEAVRLAGDKGFQDSLLLYSTMSGKQVRSIFMGLDDQTVVRYLQAMQPRTATRIIKEFKTPQEVARIQTILEMMRTSSTTQPSERSVSARERE
jgi:hypothetical protein